MESPGRQFILDLLAKSVAKINAEHPEPSDNNEKKRKDSDGSLEKKKRLKVKDGDHGRDRVKSIKTELKVGKNEEESPYYKEVKVEALKNIKTEYVEIKTEVPDSQYENKSNIPIQNFEQPRQKVKSEKSKTNPIVSSVLVQVKSEENKIESHKSIIKCGHKIESGETNQEAMKRKKPRKAVSGLVRFSPEEDKILLDAVETFGENINTSELAEQLKRPHNSVRNRLEILKTEKKKIRSYSSIEDLLIVEAVVKHLPGKSLEMLDLPSYGDWKPVAVQLDRRQTHVRNRWEYYLKPWLLQHYSGTLNLDIRRMLANYLADNYEDVESIDWKEVAGREEFKGHTEVSLHYYFGAYMIQRARLKLNGEIGNITLRHIQVNENELFKNSNLRKVGEKVLVRQKEVIDYFENYVKEQEIVFEVKSK